MKYRARVIPLYEGRRQEEKARWEYTDAASVAQAARYFGVRYPYPKYFVEKPILDLRGVEEALAKGREALKRLEAKPIVGLEKLVEKPGNPGRVKIVCAWCGEEMGFKEGEGVNGITHSICDECYEAMFGMPKYYTITDRGKTVFNVGDVVASSVLKRENERVIRLGEMPASAKSKGGA